MASREQLKTRLDEIETALDALDRETAALRRVAAKLRRELEGIETDARETRRLKPINPPNRRDS